MSKSSSTTQVQSLQSLSQQAAAWLVDISTRNLREKPDVPRNADGTYDARALVKWASGRDEAPKLSDAEHERLRIAVESLSPEVFCSYHHLVAELRAEFGDAAYAILGRAFAEYWERIYRQYPDSPEEPTREEYDRGYGDWLLFGVNWFYPLATIRLTGGILAFLRFRAIC